MIGIFDSGIGGLTVVRELVSRAPHASFIYLGDTARTPYGNKSQATIQRYALEDAKFLLSHGATMLVVACNTVSALALDSLRLAYPKFPLFDVITPAVEDAARITRGRIGLIGTRATIGSGTYQRALTTVAPHASVFTQACPLLVPLVEEGWLGRSETKRIVKGYLSPLRQQQIDTLILGCTHYPLLAPLIQRYMGKRVTLIDSASAVVTRLLERMPIDKRAAIVQRYFFTDTSPHSSSIARAWLQRAVDCEIASLEQA